MMKNKKQTLALLLLLSLLLVCFSGCATPTDPQGGTETDPESTPVTDETDPQETNLEFWIAENVDGFDFSSHQEKYGLFGGKEYYGKGYVPTTTASGVQIDPEHCVIYTVTSYPDYSDKAQHVTGIYITDPEISFYGISLNSSFDDFERCITQQGFAITESSEHKRTARKGKYSITFTKKWIMIRVEVENKNEIIF